jgi:MFS family permease
LPFSFFGCQAIYDRAVITGGAFRRLWAATAVSGLGDGVRAGALPLLAAFLTRSPAQIAGVAFAQALPWLLFGLPSGVIADRWDRRTVLVWGNVIRAAVLAALAATVALGRASLPALYAAAFCLTTVTVLADASAQSILPDVVPIDELERANGRLYTSETTASQFAGPPLGSVLFTANATVPFAVDAVSFAVSAALVRGVRGQPSVAPAERTGLLRGIGVAFGWLRHQRVLWYTIVASTVGNVGSEMLFGVFPLFALRLLRVPASAYGLLFLCYAAGAVTGGLVAARVRTLLGDGPAITLSVLGFGGPLLVMTLWPHAWLAAAMMAASGLGEGVWSVLLTSLRQAVIPAPIRGRVLATLRLFSWGSMSVGAALGGVVAEAVGVDRAAMIGCAAIVVTGVALAPLLRTAAIRALRTAV